MSVSSLAHMELKHPWPFRSSFDPNNNWSTIDYSMTNPLWLNGSNYPCKHYHTQYRSMPVVDTLVAGSSYQLQISGTAYHDGGSCQIAISYDGGQTWGVIHSIVGGCPLVPTYDFIVNPDLPSTSKALLSWTWINSKVGFRNLYQNCAIVRVNGSISRSITLPALYLANVQGTQCLTVEGTEPVYPVPGASWQLGGSFSMYTSYPPVTVLASCSIDYTRNVTIGPLSNDIASLDVSTDPGPRIRMVRSVVEPSEFGRFVPIGTRFFARQHPGRLFWQMRSSMQ
ncbi:uncharacterized protein L969DRAFT_101359 [Mixia osmundae IAM 14324]|uniref:Uncharacterized protein n=1 Tax=Mixia osmundae (strain CBS 9802 / IAM 14324 / JCM 22182 / KY 12970) TaxID=764103 RepID=G7DXS8_MIXOS|nr:uncharacterized protein L969DRAFT_101359 [Mixia osmundae IAM 14324]KEI41125.1 hypothetical protein L969DRAFT_101359 [Mixia osmundae IAM 14324]GAA95388.1 hypothetical protein E5Q_02042 [Mixia osmundae IAM 14324]